MKGGNNMRTIFKEGYHMLVNGMEMDDAVESAHKPGWAYVKFLNEAYSETDLSKIEQARIELLKELFDFNNIQLEWNMEAVRCHALIDEIVKNPFGKLLVNKALKNLES